jgi:hypothetical protein
MLMMFRGYRESPDYKDYRNVQIVKLVAFKSKEIHKQSTNPFPYFNIVSTGIRSVYLDYDWVRHANFDLNGVLDALEKSGVEDMVIENISFLVPKEWVLSKEEFEEEKAHLHPFYRASTFVATFKSQFIEAWMDGQLRKEVEEVMGDQIRELGFKHSVLDLKGVADAKSWAVGIENELNDLETNQTRLYWILYGLDPDKLLMRLRQYRLEEGRYWRLVQITTTI